VLIGLTFEETREFESLDDSAPLTDKRTEQAAADHFGSPTAAHKQRWFVLYCRHHSAWRKWITQNRNDDSYPGDLNVSA
jgi:hypothetical protein